MSAQIRTKKQDVVWSFVAQFFALGTSLITLPLVLRLLTAEEIGMNYLMMSVSAMVALIDFGFGPQFGRNITYVLAGSQELRKEGVAPSTGEINYTLLSNMIGVARRVYQILAIITLTLMLTGGSVYIYHVTDGFTNVNNSLVIWVIYSISVSCNVYYIYLGSLLSGRGLIKEARIAAIVSRIAQIIMTVAFLLLGWGLMGVVISNFIAPFVNRFIALRIFYDKEMKSCLAGACPTVAEQKKLFKIIWYNAKKLGLSFLGAYVVNKFGIFIAGLFLSLAEIASYGLMVQFVGIINSLSSIFTGTSMPMFNSLRSEGRTQQLIERFAFTMSVYYTLFIVGCLSFIILGPWFLRLIHSNAALPAVGVILLYCLVVLLENNHSNFATFIVTGNKIPFVESSLIIGAAISIGSFLVLKYTSLGILGLVLVQGLCQICYANWKWPYVVCREFHISFFRFLAIGMRELLAHIPFPLCRRKALLS